MNQQKKGWYVIDNRDDVFSPALLVYPDRIEENIRRMIAVAGDAGRLRPHVKTHKMPEIIRLQMKHGITKFKCATIAEAEMAAACGAKDMLMAYQPVGPNIKRYFTLTDNYPATKFSCIADTQETIINLAKAAKELNKPVHIWIDINTGMNRTGVKPGIEAVSIARLAARLPLVKLEGLHSYDGHLHQSDPALRKKLCDEAFAAVTTLTGELAKYGITNLKIVAGGSPTFPIHALRKDVELSPGTILLWDYGYSSAFRDMDFLNAAVLFTRVVSKPDRDLLCIDLGHKAVASEMPQPRIHVPELGKIEIISHNEEHMVIRSEKAEEYRVGSVIYAVPFHICPTVDRHDFASVVSTGHVTGQWIIEARRRKITI